MSLFKKSIILSSIIALSVYVAYDFLEKKEEHTEIVKKSISIDAETLRQVSVGLILSEIVNPTNFKIKNSDELLNQIIENKGLITKPEAILGKIDFYGESIDSNGDVKFIGYKTKEKSICKLIQKDNEVLSYQSISLASLEEASDSSGVNRMFCYQDAETNNGVYVVAYRVKGTDLGQ